MKNLPISAIVALVYIIVVSSALGLIYFPALFSQKKWNTEQETYVALVDGFEGLSRELGYNGFIHHFKDYVIKRDSYHVGLAKHSIAEAQNQIDQLKSLPLETAQLKHIDEIQATLDLYKLKIDWIINNPEEVDSLSRSELNALIEAANDQATAEAIFQLEKQTQANAISSNIKLQEMSQYGLWQFLLWLFVFTIMYIVAGYFFLKLKRSHDRKFNHLNMVHNISPFAIVLVDEHGKIVEVNNAFNNLFKVTDSNQLNGSEIERFIPYNNRDEHRKIREDFQESERELAMGSRTGQLYALRDDGQEFPVRIAIGSKIVNDKKMSLAIIEDISQENELRQSAEFDYLTGILNRRTAVKKLNEEIYRAKRYAVPLSVMLIDLDGFKEVNDSLGHAAGDEVLQRVVEQIAAMLRRTDIFARWGGDEFICILPDNNAQSAGKLAQKLIDLIGFSFKESESPITLSIGVADLKEEDNQDSIVINADAALYKAKEAGKNTYRINKMPTPISNQSN